MMKKGFIYCFLFLPQLLAAQHLVILGLSQPPELNFSISGRDTIILEGTSVELGRGLVISGGSGELTYQWSPGTALNDSLIRNPVASPADTTFYVLKVTDQRGCSFFVDYTVHVKSLQENSRFMPGMAGLDAMIIPNPNQGVFNFYVTGSPARRLEMRVTDSVGRVLHRSDILNFKGTYSGKLKLDLPGGIYQLLIGSGSARVGKQFIVR